MSTDYYLTATNLALRYAAVNVTPPAGLGNIRSSTAAPPNKLGANFPQVVVFPDNGEFDYSTNDRIGLQHFLVRFYLAEIGDISRHTTALLKWLTVLVDQTYGAFQFAGQATILAVRVMGWTIAPLTYATRQYAAIELSVEITTNERATVTA